MGIEKYYFEGWKEFARGTRDQRLKNKSSTIMVVVKPRHTHILELLLLHHSYFIFT